MSCHQVPMLLVPSEEEHLWDVYDVLEDKFLELKLSSLNDKRFSGSSQGWLVLVNEDYSITLHRSYFMSKGDISDANTTVQLPCLFPPQVFIDPQEYPLAFEESLLQQGFDPAEIEGYDYHVSKALITADPRANPNDCIIVVTYGEFYELACIRYGKDTVWTKIADGFRGFEDIVQYKNQLYAVDYRSRVISFDPYNATIKWVSPAIEMAHNAIVKRYLVESCGGLLLVERYINLSPDARERETRMFRVFKLDFDGAKWIEVKSIDDVALFVGDDSTISVGASNFNQCQANCIYFTHDEVGLRTDTHRTCDLGAYNLESKSIKLYHKMNPSIFHMMFKRPPIWIVPLPNGY